MSRTPGDLFVVGTLLLFKTESVQISFPARGGVFQILLLSKEPVVG